MPKVTRRDHRIGATGKTGIEYGTTASGAKSGIKKGGKGAEKERGSTRASQPIGHSEVTETLASYGPSRYGKEKNRRM